MKMILDQRGVQVFLDAVVQVRGDRFRVALVSGRRDGNFIRHTLACGIRACDRFGLRLGGVVGYMSTEGDDALIAVLAHGDVTETRLIERLANRSLNVRSFRR